MKNKMVRSKAGVTQADVGKALANLKLPGVGALSQSTICRFESLTLSHNNMIALKPILQAWLEEAEAQAKNKRRDPDAPSVLPAGEKKRYSLLICYRFNRCFFFTFRFSLYFDFLFLLFSLQRFDWVARHISLDSMKREYPLNIHICVFNVVFFVGISL